MQFVLLFMHWVTWWGAPEQFGPGLSMVPGPVKCWQDSCKTRFQPFLCIVLYDVNNLILQDLSAFYLISKWHEL